MTEIYGVDTEKEVTPEKVRDAMVECFFQAHCADAELGMKEVDEGASKGYCQSIVKKAFADSGGDFDKPTKESIMGAMGELKKFAANFRDPSVIQKHAGEIMKLVEKLG